MKLKLSEDKLYLTFGKTIEVFKIHSDFKIEKKIEWNNKNISKELLVDGENIFLSK